MKKIKKGDAILKKDSSKKVTVYIDKNVYLNFQIYALQNNRSVSSLIEEYMRNVLKEIFKEEK